MAANQRTPSITNSHARPSFSYINPYETRRRSQGHWPSSMPPSPFSILENTKETVENLSTSSAEWNLSSVYGLGVPGYLQPSN